MFNNENIISSFDELKNRQDLTVFEIDFKERPKESLLQELCIEIAKHTPDAKEGNNEDEKNEGRLNPFVGALLIKQEKNGLNKVYGACRSALHNGEHGECGLLTNILGDYVVDDCEMYVSLEPCTQESRHEWTEPCCEIIKNRRIRKVTIGMLDPNPDVAGQGIWYLIKSGVEVQLFEPKYQQIVLKDNKYFIDQFGDNGDPRLNRKIARILDSYVSDDAIKAFLIECDGALGIKYNPDRWNDCKHEFYQKMIENRSIIDGKSKLLPFDVIEEFALFFYEEPFHSVDAATIRYKFDVGVDSNKFDEPEIDYNGPLAFAFETYYKKDKTINNHYGKLGFIEILGKRYSGKNNKSIEDYNKAGLQFIKDNFVEEDALKFIREAFINAIMHRDYKDNKSFTTILLTDNSIIITNPVSRNMGNLETLKTAFNDKVMLSHPVNPKLMRYFMMSNVCERNNNGLTTLLKTNKISLELDNNFVLKTTIVFK